MKPIGPFLVPCFVVSGEVVKRCGDVKQRLVGKCFANVYFFLAKDRKNGSPASSTFGTFGQLPALIIFALLHEETLL